MKNDNRIIQVQDINIGNNIRQKRLEMGLKQTEIIARLQLLGCDISAFSYNRIEKGKQNPTVSFLVLMCEILSCDMNALFGIDR